MNAKLIHALGVFGLSAALAFAAVAGPDPAQPPVPPGSPDQADTRPPMPPAPKSPIEAFRKLLAMKPAERELSLTNRPPEVRKRILEKVSHYLSLKPDERELSLRITEVEWYFAQLRAQSATNRAEQLQWVPEADRQMVRSRLAIWDELSAQQQQDVLKYMALLGGGQNPGTAPAQPDQKARETFSRRLDDWRKLPPDQRREIYSRFQDFFALNEQERERTLHVLSEPEREQMQKALARFERMPAERRRAVLASLPRLAALSDQERDEFVRNADRWQAMTPAERQSLRALTNRLPPPPPALPPPLPPLPRPTGKAATRAAQGTLAATNSDK